nr:hypothetical protein [uncultured Rhodopila sp.]
MGRVAFKADWYQARLSLDQVDLSIEVSSEGQVGIPGTGGKLEGKAGSS